MGLVEMHCKAVRTPMVNKKRPKLDATYQNEFLLCSIGELQRMSLCSVGNNRGWKEQEE